MSEIKLVLIDLKPALNNIDYPFLLRTDPSDIGLLRKIEPLLRKHFTRSLVYIGCQKPHEANIEFLNDIDHSDLKKEEKEKLRELIVERKLPLEVVLILEGGDGADFHNHVFEILCENQMEQYIIPDGIEVKIEIREDNGIHPLSIKGPSIMIVGKTNHRRESGECFVTKFPSGNYKNIV